MKKSKEFATPNNTSYFSFSAEAGYGTPVITSGYSANGNRYIPYSSFSKRYNTVNTYPQMLAKLAAESPTHSAALNMKAMLTKGLGFDKEELSRNIKKRMMNMNKKNQSIDDILEQVAYDYVTFGGFALKVIWNMSGKIDSVERIHFTDVRAGEPDDDFNINYYVVSNNWDMTMPTRFQKTYALPVFNPKVFDNEIKLVRGVPQLSEEQMMNGEQIIYFYKETTSPSSNGMYFYPTPDYLAGIDCILQEVDINTSNKSLINNGMGGKTIVNVATAEQGQDKLRDLHRDIVKNFTGAENNGGLIVGFSLDEQMFPKITQLEPLSADTYNKVQEMIIQTIVTTHNIPAILLNLRNGGAWSNTADEMEQAFQIFNKTKIASYQQDIERVFNTIMGYMGYDVELQIIPFTLIKEEDMTSDEVKKEEVSSVEVSSETNTETTSLDSK